ncbi:hypothetical protein C2G38_2189009 [Gigaspora rosea]|uniref:Cation-transporting P-type ATPase C-terminal domain-containing protein n=1 Tax=Gigaspora rosea TaxID=44941 RepID=A0A397V9X2_9GLOM|nr:hypothetical protein C2G38_2189009 [Gigaspora rosea]
MIIIVRVEKAIRDLIGGGVKVVIKTEDSDQTALSIARKLGIPVNPSNHSNCLTSADIEALSSEDLSTSIAALTLITMSTVSGLPNPLNAMQILWINILMNGPPAQSLRVEPVNENVMRQPPRKKNVPILTPALIMRVLTCAAIIVAGTLFTEMQEVLLQQETQQWNIYKSNVNLAVAFSLIGQLLVIYLPFFQAVFQTKVLGLDLFGLIVITSSVFWIDEFCKSLS